MPCERWAIVPAVTAPPLKLKKPWTLFRGLWFWPAWVALGGVSVGLGAAAALGEQEQRLLNVFLEKESAACRWVVFVKNGGDAAVLGEKLRTLPGLRALDYVSKNQALERAQSDPALAEGLSLVSRNPFLESYEVLWKRDWIRPDYLSTLSEQVGAWDGVDRVVFDTSRVERAALLARLSAQRRLAWRGMFWIFLAVIVFLSARALFYVPAVRWRDVVCAPLFGAAAGGVGAAAVRLWLGGFYWEGVAVGALTGLLVALGRAVAEA